MILNKNKYTYITKNYFYLFFIIKNCLANRDSTKEAKINKLK